MAFSAVQLGRPSFGIPSFTKEYKPATVPLILQDEIDALNAIYGEGTIEIAYAYNGKITTDVRLPGINLPSIQLAFPVSYPQERPDVLDYSLLARERSYRFQSARLIILSILEVQFVKGCECIFDLLESCLPILSLLGDNGLDMREAAASIPGFIADQWLWTTSDNVNVKDIKAIQTCAICFDDSFAFKMISLPCKHYFCLGCFQNGWTVSLKSSQPFTCCKIRIGLELIETFNTSQTAEIRRYIRMLQERDTDYPFYCGYASCSALVDSTKNCKIKSKAVLAKGVMCTKCSRYTCAGCRMPMHAGKCNEDIELSLLMDEDVFRRCPKCGHGIQKNGGCSHMFCTACQVHFQWEENGAVTLYRS